MSVYKSSHRGPCFFLSARCRKNRTSRSCSCQGSPSRCRPVCSEEACFLRMSIPTRSFENSTCLEYKGLATNFLILSVSLLRTIVMSTRLSCSLACQSSFRNSLFTFFLNSVFIRMYGSIQHSCSNSSTLVHTL